MKMKKYIKFVVMVLIVLMWGLNIQPDDKELFMGMNVDTSVVKPNMMIIIDTSTSMNDVIYFPKKGLDGVAGTADDGFDPAVTYTGTFDGGIDKTLGGEFMSDYTGHYTLNETRWVGRWIVAGEAKKFDPNDTEWNNNEAFTGCYESDGTGYRFRVGANGCKYFNEGDVVMYQNRQAPYNVALATIADIPEDEKIYGDVNDPNRCTGAWITLAYDGNADSENLDPTVSIVGDEIIANADNSITRFWRAPSSADWQPVMMKLYGVREVWGSETQCQFNDAGYPENYLKWMFLHATLEQREAINHFTKFATFDVTTNIPPGYEFDEDGDGIVLPNDGVSVVRDVIPSWCDKGNFTAETNLWTRIQVTREVLCWLARQHGKRVMLGLMEFEDPDNKDYCKNFDNVPGNDVSFDPSGTGGKELDGLGDMSEMNSKQMTDYLDATYGIRANSETPLAEALADAWYYFKPGPASKSYWPVSYELERGIINNSNDDSPVKYWCQSNYVVIMTDGQSGKDDFNGDTNIFASKGGIFSETSFTNPGDKAGTDVKVKHNEDDWKYNNPNEYERWRFGWGDKDDNDPYVVDSTSYCPNEICWDIARQGTDFLDDVAYFLRNQDMFPDSSDATSPYFSSDKWPNEQVIFTYVIGFNADNDMLRETAQNGDGGYFTADTFKELKEAFANVIVSINLRNFAFSSITAPKKTSTAQNEEQTVSYVGYFLPAGDSLWEGHLLSFELIDKYGWDSNGDDIIEYIHATEAQCLAASGGTPCQRSVSLSTNQQWDAALRMPYVRDLYTHDGSSVFDFTLTNADKIKPLINDDLKIEDINGIIAEARESRLGDIFHSDVGFVGPPPFAKQFLSYINPTGANDEMFSDFYADHQTRSRVIYVGTNDGVMHMIYADDQENRDNPAGEEVWGFFPDEILPSLEKIYKDNRHTYTVDGRLQANDIYYAKNGPDNTWSTILTFGLRRGGRAYYALDITDVGTQPNLLWKFKDDIHSGQSWGKPTIARIKMQDPNVPSKIIDQWVAILTGGFEFNSGNPNDVRGKALFVVNAATGQLIWKIAYSPAATVVPHDPTTGALTDESLAEKDKFLTSAPVFNYPIPSSMLALDKDSNGFLDTIYFGNTGGHLFKANINDPNPGNWTAQLIYEDQYIGPKGPYTLKTCDYLGVDINGNSKYQITLTEKSNFVAGDTVMGTTSYATGYITIADRGIYTVVMNSGTFIFNDTAPEMVAAYVYEPLYMAPTAAYDTCYQLWIAFGTGDRDRPRTYPYNGRFITFKDNNAVNYIKDDATAPTDPTMTTSNLARFAVTGDALDLKNNPSDANGFYIDFPNPGERLFEPDPLILPDENQVPHIYFNTYQPPTEPTNKEDPCDLPKEGKMKIYDVALKNCGTIDTIEGERETGRIAGGGIYAGKEYVIYKSTSGDVADVPGGEGGQFTAETIRLPYPGGLLFWKEKKR